MRARISLLFALLLAAPSSERSAKAESAPSSRTSEENPSTCADEPGARLHDGFFARSEPGIAYLFEGVRGGPRTRARGIAQSAGLLVGGTPRPGLVVGGTVWVARFDPDFVENGVSVEPDDDSVKLTMLRVGPFVDWYPDPRGGFHAQGSLGFVLQLESDTKGDPVRPPATGVALALGAGYEWFLASELSLGFLGRVALGRMTRDPDAAPSERLLFVVPELALTATYH